MKGLRIEEHGHKYANDCSGGTKRKLSYGMAMLGDPKIVLLDEPSSGMDPHSKRFVWDTILASFKGDRGAILTTHSMEEADALCTRVGIMVKGELRCLGSTQHLKNKYGGGYVLEVKCNSQSADWNELHEDILKTFDADKTKLDEAFADRRTYSVLQSAVTSLGEVFAALESSKLFKKNSLDAGIQDSSTSISIVVKVEQPLLMMMMIMKVTNIYKHEIVDTRA